MLVLTQEEYNIFIDFLATFLPEVFIELPVKETLEKLHLRLDFIERNSNQISEAIHKLL